MNNELKQSILDDFEKSFDGQCGIEELANMKVFLSTALTSYAKGVIPEKKDEIVTEDCDNCGEEGYGKAWYGKGKATGDAWGDANYPTGSVVFCKSCSPDFVIGKEWDGEEIWKRTSDRPENEQIRINSIKKTIPANKGWNACIDEMKLSIKE